MVVPLRSHMTHLCLLQGVQATCQSRLSLSVPICLSFSILLASVLPSQPCVAACAQAACMLSLQFRAESTCSDCVVFAVASIVTNHVPLVLLLLQGLWLQAQVG